jgi:hypothetical protein
LPQGEDPNSGYLGNLPAPDQPTTLYGERALGTLDTRPNKFEADMAASRQRLADAVQALPPLSQTRVEGAGIYGNPDDPAGTLIQTEQLGPVPAQLSASGQYPDSGPVPPTLYGSPAMSAPTGLGTADASPSPLYGAMSAGFPRVNGPGYPADNPDAGYIGNLPAPD